MAQEEEGVVAATTIAAAAVQQQQQQPVEEQQHQAQQQGDQAAAAGGRPRRTRPARCAATATVEQQPAPAVEPQAQQQQQGKGKGGKDKDGGSGSKLESLAGLELRFVEAEGVISGRKWTCPLPPANVEAAAVSFEYIGAAFVDPVSKKNRTAKLGGLCVTLVAVDGEGQERARFDNGRPWSGIYYFQNVELPEPGLWTFRLSAREGAAVAPAAAAAAPAPVEKGKRKKGKGAKEEGKKSKKGAGVEEPTVGGAVQPSVQGQHAYVFVGADTPGAAAAAAEAGVSLGLAVAPRIASDYAGPRGFIRKPAVPKRACTGEELRAALQALNRIQGAPAMDPDGAKDGGHKRKGGFADGMGGGEGGVGSVVLEPAYARALLKRVKQLPCEPGERRWLGQEALVAGRSATLFHRNGLHAGLVHFVEGRKRAAMAAGGLAGEAVGEEEN